MSSRISTRTRTGANVAASGKRTATSDAPLRRAVATAAPATALEVRRALEVLRVRAPCDHRRLEQVPVGVVHRPRRRERGEVGRSLLATLRADALRDRAEHERPEQQCHRDAEDDDRRLAARVSRARTCGHQDSSATGAASPRRADGRSAMPAPASARAARVAGTSHAQAQRAPARPATRKAREHGIAAARRRDDDEVLVAEQLVERRGARPAEREHHGRRARGGDRPARRDRGGVTRPAEAHDHEAPGGARVVPSRREARGQPPGRGQPRGTPRRTHAGGGAPRAHDGDGRPSQAHEREPEPGAQRGRVGGGRQHRDTGGRVRRGLRARLIRRFARGGEVLLRGGRPPHPRARRSARRAGARDSWRRRSRVRVSAGLEHPPERRDRGRRAQPHPHAPAVDLARRRAAATSPAARSEPP